MKPSAINGTNGTSIPILGPPFRNTNIKMPITPPIQKEKKNPAIAACPARSERPKDMGVSPNPIARPREKKYKRKKKRLMPAESIRVCRKMDTLPDHTHAKASEKRMKRVEAICGTTVWRRS